MIDTEILTAKQCAQYRKCSERKLERERSTGRGPTYFRDGRQVRYYKSDVDRYHATHRRVGELRDEK
jgi:hypothetical protein